MTAPAVSAPWRNRITGYGEIPPESLLANPKNWRIHPQHQQEALLGVINDVGYVDPVMVQSGTDTVIDGHLRVSLALRDGQPVIPVQYVDLDDDEADLILATFDPITAMANADKAQLASLLETVGSDREAVQQMLADLAQKEGLTEDGKYSRSIESPVYQITGENPHPHDLTDTTKAEALLIDIASTPDLPDHVESFLRAAAMRHVVFDYAKIAEFYAHAEAPVQRLMEDSGLVIVDFDQAIESGFVRLSQTLSELEASNGS